MKTRLKFRNHEVRIRRAVLFPFFLLFCTLSPPPTSLATEFSPLLEFPKPSTQNRLSEQQDQAQLGEEHTVHAEPVDLFSATLTISQIATLYRGIMSMWCHSWFTPVHENHLNGWHNRAREQAQTLIRQCPSDAVLVAKAQEVIETVRQMRSRVQGIRAVGSHFAARTYLPFFRGIWSPS